MIRTFAAERVFRPRREPGAGLTLGGLAAADPSARIRFQCGACRFSHEVSVARTIERLKRRCLGGERTAVDEVAQFSDQPCRRCGAIRWRTLAAADALLGSSSS